MFSCDSYSCSAEESTSGYSSGKLSTGGVCDSRGQYGFVTYNDNVVEKRPQYTDYTIELEHAIGTELNDLNSEHFPRYYGMSWENNSPVLRMERIFGQMLADIKLTEQEQHSVLGRVLAAISIVNEELDVSHNDLHMNNIIVRDSDADVQAYIFRDGEEFAAKTYGMSPVVIDFGLAFPGKTCKTMKTVIKFTELGFFPHEIDKLSDPRRLLFSPGARNIPFKVKQAVTCKNLAPLGWFEHTFSDMLNDLKSTAKISGCRVSLFAAHIRLPLRAIKHRESIESAFAKLDASLTSLDIKNLLDNNRKYLRPRFSVRRIRKLRRQCKNVVLAMNNIVCKIAAELTEQKKKLYEPLHVSCSRDVARMLMTKVEYSVGMKVCIYRVDQRTSQTVTITKEAENLLSLGKSLKEVFS